MVDISEQNTVGLKKTLPQEVTLRIEDLSRGGAGVARCETAPWAGMAVFVPLTCPQDLVRANIHTVKKNYAQATLVEVLEPSPLRVVPRCPVFGECGGCQWQHVAYEQQWKTKVTGVQKALLQSLQRIEQQSGKPLARVPSFTFTWDELPAEVLWNYRNRVQLRGETTSDGLKMGFLALGSDTVVDVERCDIARPEINERWAATRKNPPAGRFKIEFEVLPKGEVRTWHDRPHGAGGFRQVHDEQNSKIKTWIADRFVGASSDPAAPLAQASLLDLFGGEGNFSHLLWNRVKKVACVDRFPSGKPARTPEMPAHLEFYAAPVAGWLQHQQPRTSPSGPVYAILDPPRAGLTPDARAIVRNLIRLGVTHVALVSCSVDAFCKDLQEFLSQGFQIERAAIADLFPHTVHVESLAFLRYS